VCPLGYYQGQKEWTNCSICIAGKFSPRKASSCSLCPRGYFQENNATQSCDGCPAGYFTHITTQSFCKSCPAGYYQGYPIQTDCTNCIKGYYNDELGQTSCPKKCRTCSYLQIFLLLLFYYMKKYLANFHFKFPFIFLRLCTSYYSAPGRYGDSNALVSFLVCKLCPKGRYLLSDGGDELKDCLKCAAGQYSTEEGCNNYTPDLNIMDAPNVTARNCTFSCNLCPKGKWSDTIGAIVPSTCKACDEGKYLDYKGAEKITDCIDCPAGRYGLVRGAISGIFISSLRADQMCTGCTEGKYNQERGTMSNSSCLDCPKGYWLETTNDRTPSSNVKQSDCKVSSIYNTLCTFFQSHALLLHLFILIVYVFHNIEMYSRKIRRPSRFNVQNSRIRHQWERSAYLVLQSMC
jgi:hypothetical protein